MIVLLKIKGGKMLRFVNPENETGCHNARYTYKEGGHAEAMEPEMFRKCQGRTVSRGHIEEPVRSFSPYAFLGTYVLLVVEKMITGGGAVWRTLLDCDGQEWVMFEGRRGQFAKHTLGWVVPTNLTLGETSGGGEWQVPHFATVERIVIYTSRPDTVGYLFSHSGVPITIEPMEEAPDPEMKLL